MTEPTSGGEHRGDQHADLGLVGELGALEGQPGDEERHGEPDAGDAGHAEHVARGDALGEPSPAEPHDQGDGAGDPDELADDQPDDDAEGDRRRGGVAQRRGGELDARVGEREQRDDEVARPGVQEVLEVLGDGDRLAESEGDARAPRRP